MDARFGSNRRMSRFSNELTSSSVTSRIIWVTRLIVVSASICCGLKKQTIPIGLINIGTTFWRRAKMFNYPESE